MSAKIFDGLPADLQDAIMKAGNEAGAFGRALESGQDGEKLQQMIDAGQIFVTEFEGREQMLELVKPVQDAYAAELGATELLENVRGM